MTFDPRRSIALGVLALSLVAVWGPDAEAQESRAELTPDGAQVLVNKDVGGERWAIARNLLDGGTVTGNVFPEGGGEPAFLWCEDLSDDSGGDLALSCFSAPRCETPLCSARDWVFVSDVVLPRSFFDPGDPRVWDSIGEPITLPRSFFDPPSSPDEARESGVRPTLDGGRVLVNKDVDDDRWAITWNLREATVTGNVFSGRGGEPDFLWCEELDPPADGPDDLVLSCFIPGDGAPEPQPEPELPLHRPAEWVGRLLCGTKYPGSFAHLNPLSILNDPDLVGACFKCPSGFERTVFSIESNEACQKGPIWNAQWRPVTQVGRYGCKSYGPDVFQNLLLDQCYRCPSGYHRSLEPGIDLTGNDRACRRS